MMHGTRKPPSPTVPLVFLNGGHAAIRPGEHLGTVVGSEDDDGVAGLADVVEMLEQGADASGRYSDHESVTQCDRIAKVEFLAPLMGSCGSV
jgi:hypothetical protein